MLGPVQRVAVVFAATGTAHAKEAKRRPWSQSENFWITSAKEICPTGDIPAALRTAARPW